MSPLDRIIERVEAGECPASAAFARCWAGHGGLMAARACAGSLDAAKALHEALLPGWEVRHFMLAGEVMLQMPPAITAYGHAPDNPARAWLLAILKAYRAETEDAV